MVGSGKLKEVGRFIVDEVESLEEGESALPIPEQRPFGVAMKFRAENLNRRDTQSSLGLRAVSGPFLVLKNRLHAPMTRSEVVEGSTAGTPSWEPLTLPIELVRISLLSKSKQSLVKLTLIFI